MCGQDAAAQTELTTGSEAVLPPPALDLRREFAIGQTWRVVSDHCPKFSPTGMGPVPLPGKRFRIHDLGIYGEYDGFIKVSADPCPLIGWLDPRPAHIQGTDWLEYESG